ncbi:MAG: hypothetical protein Q8L41_16525 [Anaerolineales bacterium]|nr:hypothetical protein [Anaerolineales bacterium]
MKLSRFLFRVGFSLSIAFAISFSSAVIYFDYSGYTQTIDRFSLVAVPTLALAFLLYEISPKFWAWFSQRQVDILLSLGLLALLAAIETVLTVGTSRVYYLGTLAFALALFTVMLPAAQPMERLRLAHSTWHYLIGFFLSLFFTYGAMGFLSGTLDGRFHIIGFSMTLTILGSLAGYYLVRRAARSLKDGFLSNGLNIFLALILPVFVVVIFYISTQFPSMFRAWYFQIPTAWFDLYLSSAIVAGAWGIPILEQIETRGIYQSFSKTKAFLFIKENLPGIYAGAMFFLVNLVLARAFNHPTFSLNSIVFEADAGPWLAILGYPEGFNVNRAVHPLVLITLRPFVRLIGLFVGEKWFLAPMIAIAAISGSAVLMAWIFVKRAAQKDTYAFIFAVLLGTSASHLLFGSLTETYVFGMASLIFFFLLIQADEKRFSVLVPAGLLVFGIAVTNLAQSMIGLFFKKFGFRRLVYYGVLLLAAGIALTAFVSMLYPGNQSFFYVPQDISFEARFTQPIYADPLEGVVNRIKIVGRTVFLYDVLAPTPIEVFTGKQAGTPIINLKTYHYKDDIVAWYDGLANIPLVLWFLLLVASLIFFLKNIRSQDTPLLLGLLGSIAFNYFLHMNYGTELFLYTPYWTFLLVFFISVSLKELAGYRWLHISLTVFLLMLMANNARFMFIILRGLSPYFGFE